MEEEGEVVEGGGGCCGFCTANGKDKLVKEEAGILYCVLEMESTVSVSLQMSGGCGWWCW